MKAVDRKYTIDYFLLSALAVAFGVRAWNIWWGLPDIYEEATPFFKAWGFWNWSKPGFDFNPHFFNYPALTFYFNFIGQLIHYCLGYLLGLFPTLQSYFEAFKADPTPFILTARFISLGFDIGTVYFVDRLSRDIGPPSLRYIATPLAALSLLLIQQSHLVNVDTPLTFFTVLVAYFIRKGQGLQTVKSALVIGTTIGLAASSKYTGGMLLLMLIADRAFAAMKSGKIVAVLSDRGLYISMAASLLTFIAINPFIALDYPAFMQDFGFEQEHMASGHLGIQPGESSVSFYLLRILPQSFGVVFYAFVIIGIVRAFMSRDEGVQSTAFFVLFTIGTLSTWEMRAERYLLPITPLMIIVGSIGIAGTADLVLGKIRTASTANGVLKRISPIMVTIGLAALPVGYQISELKAYQESAGLPDTRNVVKEWILRHVPPGSLIASPPYGIALPADRYFIMQIPFLPVNPERVEAFYDTRWYQDFDVVIASDYDLGRYQLEPARYAKMLKYYETLESSWTQLFETTPTLRQRGPLVRLFRFPDSLRQERFDPALLQTFSGAPESASVSNFLKILAFFEQKKGNLKKIDQLLSEVLSVEYHNIDVRKSHAAVLHDLGRYAEALGEIETCLSLDSTRFDLFSLQGIILERLRRGREAEDALLRAIRLNPTSTQTYDQLLAFYVGQKDKTKTLDLLKRYLSVVPPGSDKAQKIEQDIQTLMNH